MQVEVLEYLAIGSVLLDVLNPRREENLYHLQLVHLERYCAWVFGGA